MDYSDVENDSDGGMIDDILEPEDLFSDEAEETGNDETKEKTESQEQDSTVKVEKKVKQPRIVKNPRVTLNVEKLKGSNGLSALKKLFKDFKFKGTGHEQEDLTKIMNILQHWMCFQLCPSYDFESCMLQLEALGRKKVVQTLIKKYRMGIDDWGENKSDAENNDVIESHMEISENTTKPDEFDLLLDEEIANATSDPVLSQNEISQTDIISQTKLPDESNFTLTPEQLERIARNRKLAEERRLKRMSTQCEQMETNEQHNGIADHEISLDRIQLEEK